MAVHTAEPGNRTPRTAPFPLTRSPSGPLTRSPSGQGIFRDDPVPDKAPLMVVTPGFDVPAATADLQWQVGDFVETTDGVRHALVLSPAGQVLASSGALDRDQADQFATVVFTLGVLAQSLDTVCGTGLPRRTMVDLRDGVLCLKALPGGFFLAVMAASDGSSRQVGSEATCLAARIGTILRPQV